MAKTRTYRFRSRPEAVAAARQALAGLDEVLDAGAFYDASLCVSELVTNAVIHADIGADAELRLDVALADDGRLRVEVTDSGSGFMAPQPVAGDGGGWGLFLVDRLSDRWGVRTDAGSCVWFEMTLRPSERDRPGTAAGGAAGGRARERRDARTRSRVAARLRPGSQSSA